MDTLKSGIGSLYSLGKDYFLHEKDTISKNNHGTTLQNIGELKRVMSTPEFLQLEESKQGIVLFNKGDKHLSIHHNTEGGNADELSLAMSFFDESSKLGNCDAIRNIKIQLNVEKAIDCYDRGLEYWDGLDGCEVDKDKAKMLMKQACDLGLFAAHTWCKKYLERPYPLIVKIND